MTVTRRGAAAWIASAAAFACTGAFAQNDGTPRGFLAAIYDSYKGNSDKVKGIPLSNPTTVRNYFEHALAELIIKDIESARARRNVPQLNGDPFIDAQDWEIRSFAIRVKEAGPGKATGTVSFANFGRKETVIVELVRLKDGWRIADIDWGTERGTLRGLLAGK